MRDDGELLGDYGSSLPVRVSWLSVRISRADWERLLTYDCSIPTGVVLGKKWRRTERTRTAATYVGRMSRDLDGEIRVVFSPAIIDG